MKKRSSCPLNIAVEEIGDKWSLVVIRDLMRGKRFYGELLKSDEGIASNILASRLQKLEALEIISKSSDETHKQKIRYSLTQKGIDLVPVVHSLMMWSSKYSNQSKEIVDELKRTSNQYEMMKKQLIKDHLKN